MISIIMIIIGCIASIIFVASFIIHIGIAIHRKLNANTEYYSVKRESMVCIADDFYVFPSIRIITGRYLEIMFNWLKFEYYINYTITGE